MKKALLFVSLFTFGSTFAQDCSELFISEYVEGSGNDKALEIYNPTSSAINLTGYRIERFSNGSSTSASGGVTNLSGTIAAYSTFVIVNGQTTGTPTSPAVSLSLQAMADQLDGAYPAPTYMNGNDAIALFHNTTMIDLVGKTGDASMTTANGWGDQFPYDGTVGRVWTENHTLIRKASVKSGVTVNPDPFIVNIQWDSLPKDTWTNLNSHTCNCVLGVEEITSSVSVIMYPNPTTNGLINLNSSDLIYGVEIKNMLGQTVITKTFSEKSLAQLIDATILEKGVYLVNISFENKSTQLSLVIQ